MKKKVMISINTSKVPFLFGGLRETMWSSYLGFEDEIDLIDFGGYSDNESELLKKDIDDCLHNKVFDVDKALSDIGGCIIEELNSSFCIDDEYVRLLEVRGVYPPQFYNFSSGGIEFTALIKPDDIIKKLTYFIDNYRSMVERYHKNNWETCGDYISSMPILDEIYQYINDYDFESCAFNTTDLFEDIVCLLLCLWNEVCGEYSEYNAFDNFRGNSSPYDYYNTNKQH